MKKITLLILTLFLSFAGYSQFPTPGTEGFEGTTGADLPAPTTPSSWTLGTGVTGNQWAVFDNGVGLAQRWGINNGTVTPPTPPLVYAGTNAAYINRENIGLGNTSEDYLATPLLTVPTNGQLRFFSRTFTNGNTGTLYQVKVAPFGATQTSPTAYATLLAEYNEDQLTLDPDGVQNPFNVYTEKVIDFPASMIGQQVYVAFVMKYTQTTTGISGDRWLLDNVRIAQKCLDPTTLTATGVVYNGATLNWANPSGATSWEIEIVPIAAAPTGSGTVYSGTLPYVVTGLTPNTAYKYYVRALCGDGINSAWAGPQTFTTPIAPPICGGNYLDSGLATGNYSNNTDSTITICPVTPGDVVTVTFTSFNTETNADGMYVFNGNSITAPQMASTNPAGTVPGGLAGSYWGTTIPGPFTSSSPDGCLTFRFRSGAATVAPGWTSNITCGPPPPCSEPISVTRTAITATSVTLGWTNTNAATEWQCLALPCGSPAPTASATGWVTATTNPFVLNTLNPDTCYDFYVRAVCSSTDISDWTSPVSATTQMIPPACGGTFSDPGGSSANYANNTNSIVTICPTTPGDVVTVTFTSFNTQATADGLYIFNGNAITSPLISSGNPAGTVPGGLAGSYWGTANPGSFTSTSPDGCLTFRFRSGAATNAAGWTSNVTCGPPPTCPQPQSFITSSVTHNSVNLAWTETGTATAWQVLALPCGSPFPTASATGWVSATSNPFVLGGLTSETCYDIYVRSECSTSDLSTWAGPKTITTIIAPPVCGGPFVDPGGASGNYGNNANVTWNICPSIPGQQVTVTFTSFATENNFDFLRVYDGPTAAATLIGTYTGATLPPQIEASSASGCLTFVFTSDGSGVNSGWVANVTCAPPPTCPKPINLVATGLSASSVNLTWTENGTATSWEVIIQPAGTGLPPATAVGTIVTTTSYTAVGLMTNVNYEYYVRAICSSSDISNWAGPRNFILITSCADSISFCGDEGDEQYNGTTGVPSLGSPGCLGSTPNPAWYNFQVDTSGSINFQISQTNSATGNPIDVDFILWGPLTGPTCTALYDYPDGNTAFPTNIVDCSYSTAAIEFANIPNAIAGQYYTLLITNFSNQPSNIVFGLQTSSTGSASCPCSLELGTDVTVCGTSYTINATSTNSTGFAWYNGTDLIPGETTSSLTVTSSGTYKCIIQCGTLPSVEDTITVTLNSPTVPTFNPIPNLCQNSISPTLPLTSLNGITGTWSPSTIDTTTSGTVVYEFTPDVIPTQTCVDTTSLSVTIIAVPVPDAPTNVVACDSYTLPALTTGNYYTASNGGGTMLNAGHTILLPGTTTLYVYAESGTTPNCTAENSFTVTINTIDAQVVSDVTACDSYVLPALNANNSYYTASNGGGTMLNAGDVITTSQTIYVWAQSGTTPNCTDESSFNVTINTTPVVAPISNVTACDSYTLPAVAVGNYYTAPNGGGTILPAGTVITSTQTIYCYASTGTTPNCSDEESFIVTINSINAQTLSNVTACDSYVLPALNPNNSYYTAPNGGGTMLTAGSLVSTSQTIYILAQTGTTPNCTDESSFTVTINTTPDVAPIANVTACDSYTLPALSVGNYYTAPNGGGTMLAAGTVLTSTTPIYVYASTGTTPNCSDEETFTVTISSSPQFTIEGGCEGGAYVLEVIPTGFLIENASYQWTNSSSTVVGTNSPTLQVSTADDYSCQVTIGGCSTTEEFAANDIGCMIPKGISPNGDEFNQNFDLSGFNVKQLSIYNRYGTKVYSKKSYTNQWEGQSDAGEELPDGTYYYVVERNGAETMSGWVYINREVK